MTLRAPRASKEFALLDRRVIVRATTKIRVADDPRAIRAKPAVRQLELELEAYWRGLRDGKAARPAFATKPP